MKSLKKFKITAISAFIGSLIASPVIADDTEIFFGQSTPANVLLVLDTSGSMTTVDASCRNSSGVSYTCTRLEAMQQGVKIFLDGVQDNVRVGIMRFPAQDEDGDVILGGELLFSVATVGDTESGFTETNRQRMKNIVDGFVAAGGTPLTQTFLKSAEYFADDFKHLSGSNNVNLDYRETRRWDGYSYEDTWVQPFGTYAGDSVDTPVVPQCSIKNKIVLLTDGQPNSTLVQTRNGINSIIPGTTNDCNVTNENDRYSYNDRNGYTWDGVEYDLFSGRKCAVALAGHISSNDMVTGVTGSSVQVDTLGFALGPVTTPINPNSPRGYLGSVATAGGGQLYEASDSLSLAQAFDSALSSSTTSGTFVAPSVPLSQSNRLTSGNEVFLAMYRPLANNVWPGNLKKYYLKEGKIHSEDTNQADNIGALAVDPSTGQFLTNASSAWSTNDGNNVIYGGAGPRVDNGGQVYTNLFSNALTNSKNIVGEAMADELTLQQIGELFGAGTTRAEAKQYFKWIAEKKIVTDYDLNNNGTIEASEKNITLNRFGDPLHSQPKVLNYDSTNRTAFIATNQGFLHAINPDNGNVRWSFMPRQLFKNVKNWRNDFALASPDFRDYGLDGDITIYIRDKDKDRFVDAAPSADNDLAMLYVGQRRGGNRYFGLNVTAMDSPRIQFTVQNDVSGDGVDVVNKFYTNERVTEINNLGQTWSKPVAGRVKYTGGGGSKNKRVVMFGGGYDPKNDDYSYASTSGGQRGNSFHMLNWWNGRDYGKDIAAMNGFIDSSVPSDVTFLDINNDEFIDTAYISDIAGKIYRVDLPLSGNAGDFKSGKVADLSGSAGNNRFYNKPDVVFDSFNGDSFAMIGIGSGYRAHPLDTGSTDRFHLLFDKSVITKSFTSTINFSNLNDNSNPSGSGFKNLEKLFDDGDKGWYISLSPNEKILSDSVTFNGRTFFTTYTPTASADVCAPPTGKNVVYGMNIADSTPVVESFDDGDNLVEAVDRTFDLEVGSITDGIQAFFQLDDDGNIVSSFFGGTQSLDLGDDLFPVKTVKWRETTE